MSLRRHTTSPWRIAGALALLSGLAIGTPSLAVTEQPASVPETPAEPAAAVPPTTPVPPAHFLVLRLSEDMLCSLVDKQIDVQTSVRDVVLGTPVSGIARVTGRPRVILEPSQDQARFRMTVSGTVHSRTVGHSGPATIHGHSVTTFTANAPILFEPGRGFSALAPQIQASTQVFTDRIVPTRPGLIGRIVERRAWDQVRSQQPQLTAIARQRATTRITAAFSRHLDERIARLNQAIEFRTTLASLRNQADGTPQIVCCTTDKYLEIADTLGATRTTIDLPVYSAASAANAPIELWVHNRVLPEPLATSLKALLANPDQNGVVNTLTLLPGTMGKDAAAALSSFIADNQITVQSLEDWTVLELSGRQPQPILQVADRPPRY